MLVRVRAGCHRQLACASTSLLFGCQRPGIDRRRRPHGRSGARVAYAAVARTRAPRRGGPETRRAARGGLGRLHLENIAGRLHGRPVLLAPDVDLARQVPGGMIAGELTRAGHLEQFATRGRGAVLSEHPDHGCKPESNEHNRAWFWETELFCRLCDAREGGCPMTASRLVRARVDRPPPHAPRRRTRPAAVPRSGPPQSGRAPLLKRQGACYLPMVHKRLWLLVCDLQFEREGALQAVGTPSGGRRPDLLRWGFR